MTTEWRKSSRSQGTSDCVEVTPNAVRDSKNPFGPILTIGNMNASLKAIKVGQLERLAVR